MNFPMAMKSPLPPPRNYPFHFRHAGTLSSHYAMIGMAHVAPDNGVDYPLYYDACNEKGVCMAGLNFVGNAAYADIIDTKENVAQFELRFHVFQGI